MTENKSEELRKVSSRVQSTTSNSLTVPSMQHRPPKQQEEAYLGLSYIKTKSRSPKWQIALALMPPLEVHGAIER